MEFAAAGVPGGGGLNAVSAPFAGARIAPGPGVDVAEMEVEPAKPILDTEVDGYKEQDVSSLENGLSLCSFPPPPPPAARGVIHIAHLASLSRARSDSCRSPTWVVL